MTEQVQITIVGTGCIGTSLGLALHRASQPMVVVGHDKDHRNAGTAQRLKAVDKAEWNLINACEKADIVVLALPLSGIRDTLKAIAPHLRSGCVVTDTASLKQPVLRWAEELLPETVSFVGGDPVVSPSGSGPEAAAAGLFDGAIYCVVAGAKTHPDAVALTSNWVSLVGAQPYYLEAAEHDGLMAGAAHLPLALALALADDTMHAPSWREMRKLAGGSLDTITALIGDDPSALSSLLLANQGHLVAWLDSYGDALGRLRRLISSGEADALTRYGEQAIATRHQWMSDRRDHFADSSATPPIERPNLLRQMLIGGGLGRRPREDKRKP